MADAPWKFKSGWEYNQDRILAAEERCFAAGCAVVLDQGRPDIKGYWKRLQAQGITGVFAQDLEFDMFGKWHDSWLQARGTCVGQGWGRSLQDTYIARLVRKTLPGTFAGIAYEVAYAGARIAHWGGTHPWGCQCGDCPDGLQGQEFAEWCSIKGVMARRKYGNVDLTRPREDLAITWNNDGLPNDVKNAGDNHKVNTHKCQTWDDVADAVAAECFGSDCLPQVFYGTQKDKLGCCEPDGNGGHCTEIAGVFLLPNGETAFLKQQSWPLGAVHYSNTIQTASGPKQVRPGAFAVRKSVLEGLQAQYRNRVEMHVVDFPAGSSFR